MKVKQLENKNQFVIESDEVVCFQSYDSLVAIYEKKSHLLTLGRNWDYSNTTKKHLYIFINKYCYLPQIDNELEYSNNKTKTINKLIKEKVIFYDDEMK